MPPSKTARRSSPTGKPGVFQPSADVRRIVPLDRGRHAYVNTHEGKTVHMSTASDEFVALVASMDGEGRVTRELAVLAERYPDFGWDRVAERVAAFVPAEPEAAEEA